MRVLRVMMRELQILRQNHIYRFCMVLFPILVIIFFTTMLDDGLPTSMPVGIVDLDNTSTTRALERKLDGFQMSTVSCIFPRAPPLSCSPPDSPRYPIITPTPPWLQVP